MNTRIVRPEILETLDCGDPAAIQGRKDLLLVNNVMGNHRWITRTLRRHYQPGWHITELGAGDGALSLRLLKARVCTPRDLHAFDLAVRPPHWPTEAAWTQGDLFQHPLPDSEVLIANLFLHHFTDAQLAILAGRISPQTQMIIASEPARYRIHSILGRALCTLARLNAVTRHDMQVSIRAGFRGDELGRALALGQEWSRKSSAAVKGAYHFLAWKAPSSISMVRPSASAKPAAKTAP